MPFLESFKNIFAIIYNKRFYQKLNFIRFIGRFKKYVEKLFLTPIGSVRQYD